MAEFSLTIPDDQIARVTVALCSPFSVAYNNAGVTDPSQISVEVAIQNVIEIIKMIVVEVEIEAAKANILPPDITLPIPPPDPQPDPVTTKEKK